MKAFFDLLLHFAAGMAWLCILAIIIVVTTLACVVAASPLFARAKELIT